MFKHSSHMQYFFLIVITSGVDKIRDISVTLSSNIYWKNSEEIPVITKVTLSAGACSQAWPVSVWNITWWWSVRVSVSHWWTWIHLVLCCSRLDLACNSHNVSARFPRSKTALLRRWHRPGQVILYWGNGIVYAMWIRNLNVFPGCSHFLTIHSLTELWRELYTV